MRFLPLTAETCDEEWVNSKPQGAKLVVLNGSKHRVRAAGAKRCCSKWEHHAMASHSAQQLLSSLPEPRQEHPSYTDIKQGGEISRLQPKGTFLRLLPQASANVWQVTDVRSSTPHLWIWESLCFKTEVSPQVVTNLLALLLCCLCQELVKGAWHSTVSLPLEQKKKNLVSTLQCHPQQKRRNITKYQ